MRPDLDDFEEMNADPGMEPRSRAMSWLVLGVAVVGFAALAYYAYQSGTRSVNDGNVLIVNAEPGPVKETPANPGGEEFPNKDKTIYNAVSGNAGGQKVEKLLPDSEKPVIPEPAVSNEAKAPAKEESKSSPTTFVNSALSSKEAGEGDEESESKPPQKITAEEAKPAAPAPTAPAAKETKAAPAPAPAPAAAEKPAPAPESAIPATPAPKPAKAEAPAKPAPAKAAAKPAATNEGAYKIQLGAFKSEAEAKSVWAKVSAAHSDIVKGSPIIVKADLPNGTFYRLRASGFSTPAAAKSACTKLAAADQACFYVGK